MCLYQAEGSDIEVVKLIDGNTSVWVAQLKAGKGFPSHYHKDGSEIYHILSGEGKMDIGKLSGTKVIWEKSDCIKTGDVFEVKANWVLFK